ncbi:hypothetical protein [Streptomyces venezuelae]|nr:hypothetical protein [Streptomyces venezuelae]
MSPSIRNQLARTVTADGVQALGPVPGSSAVALIKPTEISLAGA